MDGDASSNEELEAIALMKEEQKQGHQVEQPPPQQEVVYVPLWSNLKLPLQACSTVAHAAHLLRSVPTSVPENAALLPSKRRGDAAAGAYRAPEDPQTLATYAAYAALSVVTVLHRESDAPLFVAAEQAELNAASGLASGPSHDTLAAAPRNLALTLLVQDSATCKDRALLLDAMAFLAHTGEPSKRAAKAVRLAVLTNAQAHTYLATAECGGTKLKRAKETVLALAYVADGGGRAARYEPIVYSDSAEKALEGLLKAVAKLFKRAKIALPPSLAPDPPEAGALEGAYVKACLALNSEFWGRMCVIAEAPKLDYQLRFGTGPEQQTFVKLQPRKLVQLDDPEVYFGMLMFREGMDVAKEQYVLQAMQHERYAHRFPPEAPVGLRPPVGRECDACPHILSMCADRTSFRNELCLYTTRTAPGKMMTPLDNASMPRLKYALDPYTEEFKGDNWVFPCTQDQCDEQEDRHWDAQWQAAKRGFAKYGRICGLTAYQGDAAPEGSEAPILKTKKLKGVAALEDQALATMVGMPLGSAFRLGEVNDALSRTQQRLPAIRSYIQASIERLGSDASMAEALLAAAGAETERAVLSAKVMALERLLEKRSDAPPPQPSAPPCSMAVAQMCFRVMNLKSKASTPVPMPMTPGRAIGIGRVLYVAKQDPPLPKDKYDDQISAHCAPCVEMNAVSTAAYMAEKMHQMPLHILVALADDQGVEFYKSSDRGNGCIVKVSPLEMMEASTQSATRSLMIKYDVAAQRVSALVPIE